VAGYAGQRIVILGLARQGVALARYLAQAGARVLVSDQQPAEKLQAALEVLSPFPIEYALGGHPPTLLDGADRLCLSGGVDINAPLAQEALRRGIPLSNDSQIFLEHCPPGVTTIGITSSAGKTTTTTLVGRMLTLTPLPPTPTPRSQAPGVGGGPGVRVWVGGNIGNPLIADLPQMRAGDFAVMELSSFQLEIMTRSPRVAAVLNITPNHLDRHGTMEVYAAAKSHILRHQSVNDVAVLGADDAGARALAPLAQGRLVWFSGADEVNEGGFLRGDALVWRWDGREQTIGRTSDIGLRGFHNVLNVLAACAISGAAGAEVEAMRAGFVDFVGVAHRLEFVREWNGARWYNDSIASAPERVIAALKSFEEPIVLLAGGRDKKLPWGELAARVNERVKHTVLFGEAAPLIEQALRAAQLDAARYTSCKTLAEAVHAAARHARAGDVILLSPGCTSFDAFKDFAERGEKYKEWVNELKVQG
jgi:UDP-N-acetylmuramoylalanine--D-glutamate ligase